MVTVTEMLGEPTGPPEGERLEWERLSRKSITLIFSAAMEDRYDVAYSIYQEAAAIDEWFAVAVWCGLPNTLKQKLREQEHEHGTERTDRRQDLPDPDMASRR